MCACTHEHLNKNNYNKPVNGGGAFPAISSSTSSALFSPLSVTCLKSSGFYLYLHTILLLFPDYNSLHWPNVMVSDSSACSEKVWNCCKFFYTVLSNSIVCIWFQSILLIFFSVLLSKIPLVKSALATYMWLALVLEHVDYERQSISIWLPSTWASLGTEGFPSLPRGLLFPHMSYNLFGWNPEDTIQCVSSINYISSSPDFPMFLHI